MCDSWAGSMMNMDSMPLSRRSVLKTGANVAGALAMKSTFIPAVTDASKHAFEGFRERGYYITFMRATTFSFDVWKDVFDAVKADGGNLILLWMGGAFPSRKFPITWKYNAEHQNNQHNFAGSLIDYAHASGIRVLLCLTPFGYDGVNQYALQYPHLKAIDKDGNFTAAFGLGAWGFNLNPFLAESQQFMFEYTRELLDFYPNADGLMLESSDYAISYCKACPETFYQKEFEFVKRISAEVWSRNPGALVVIYPHYFSGQAVPGMETRGAHETFDPRWGLFFTPHSTSVDAALIQRARTVLYWDTSPTFGNPLRIQAAAQKARDIGASGFTPSFEPWTYVLQGPDGGDQFMVGQRLAPFGFGWLAAGASPVHELMIRVARMAYREFSRDPSLALAAFHRALMSELFRESDSASLLDDLLFVQESFFLDRTWVSVCAIASPSYVQGLLELGRLSPATLEDYRRRRSRLAVIADRYRAATDPGVCALRSTAQWIVDQWQASSAHERVDAHVQ
jgi:hypothetical protein